ncbi:PEGA domain-containing protein [bacterium]|nr:PEGA domain-containing protein [bacterium]
MGFARFAGRRQTARSCAKSHKSGELRMLCTVRGWIVLIVFACVALSAQAQMQIGVVDLKPGAGVSQEQSLQASEALRTALANSAEYEVVNRDKLIGHLRDYWMDMQEGTIEQAAVQIGRNLNLDRIVTGSLAKSETGMRITAQMLSTEYSEGKITLARTLFVEGAFDEVVEHGAADMARLLSGPVVKGKGNLAVESDPSGAVVYLNGVHEPRVTPVTFTDLDASVHKVTLKKEYHAPVDTFVVVEVGKTTTLKADLPKRGKTLVVKVDVNDVDIFLNGDKKGRGSINITGLRPGTYTLEAMGEKYEPFKQKVEIGGDDITEVSVVMEFAQSKLDIDSSPQDAYVTVDDRRIGRTPITHKVEPGHYVVAVKRGEYGSKSKRVRVRHGETKKVRFNLARLDRNPYYPVKFHLVGVGFQYAFGAEDYALNANVLGGAMSVGYLLGARTYNPLSIRFDVYQLRWLKFREFSDSFVWNRFAAVGLEYQLFHTHDGNSNQQRYKPGFSMTMFADVSPLNDVSSSVDGEARVIEPEQFTSYHGGVRFQAGWFDVTLGYFLGRDLKIQLPDENDDLQLQGNKMMSHVYAQLTITYGGLYMFKFDKQ